MYKLIAILFSSAIIMTSGKCSSEEISGNNINKEKKTYVQSTPKEGQASAIFASGCFWCVEAIFESVTGVSEAVSGYSGGKASTANYSAVSGGRTLHAEAVEVFYDPEVVSYETLLEVFFGSHDPTTLNQQGPDRGPQYRSAIFYKNESEKALAEAYIKKLLDEGVFSKITTEVAPLEAFYAAEEYHQNYEKRNPNQPYVKAVSVPRLKRFQKKYPNLLKSEAH
jgi:peptide-methionine (S)-S-oxide reductase